MALWELAEAAVTFSSRDGGNCSVSVFAESHIEKAMPELVGEFEYGRGVTNSTSDHRSEN